MSVVVGSVAGMRYDEAWNAVVELAASRHGAFHAAEAALRGVTQDRLRGAVRAGELRRPHPRVYVVAAVPPSWVQQLHVAVLSTRHEHDDGSVSIGAISHRSAAAVHGLVPHPPPVPSLWVPTANRVRAPGYRVHRGRAVDSTLDITVVDRLRVVNRAASVCQLASDGAPDLGRVLDVFSRTSSMAWLDATIERWEQHSARSVGRLPLLLADLGHPFVLTDSWFESVVLGLMSHPDMPPIATQFELTIDGHRYRIDIAIPAVQIGIEAHSRTFHWGPGRGDADNVRDLRVGSAGWQLFYVTWWQAHHPEEFVELLVAAVRSRLEKGVAA